MPTAYFGTLNHTVVPGDSLFKIAYNYNTTIENIMKFNEISNMNMIYPGQNVVVPLSPPEAIVYTVNSGDTIYSIARKYGTFIDNIIRFNYLSPPYLIYPGQQLVVTASLR
ncbi:MAG: hypothetical protein K0Q97_2675 [Bacillota bacterium]|jgi:LysM repeat protein|nr:hypothetical protein [Bacillota bacterium]MDF2949724.1 hypothetical protein [Sedimentibacter sp.]